ncbi:MAG: flagellin FliC [Magnetococcus sp. DMHC-8]
MTISINNSTTLLMTRQVMERLNGDLQKNFQRLASGVRVNSASDGGSAVAVAMRMAAQVSGTSVAKQNANDAMSLLQVADAALRETANALQKVRDLAVDATTSTKSANDRAASLAEVKQLVSEISRLATDTSVFGQKPLRGAFTATVQVDAEAGRAMTMAIAGASLQLLDLGRSGSKLNVSTAGSASAAIGVADAALNSVAQMRAALGGMQSRLSSIVSSLDSLSLAYTGARSRIMDTDMAAETADMTRNSIRQQASIAVMAQANMQSQSLLKLLNAGGGA